MNQSINTRDSQRHKRQISLGDSPFRPSQNEILTLTHYQFESLYKNSFLTNTPCAESINDRFKTDHTPKAEGLNIKLTSFSKVLPAINQRNLSLSKTRHNFKDTLDYILPEPTDHKTSSISSSRRIALSEYESSPSHNLISNHSNISRFQLQGSSNGQDDGIDLSYIKQKDYIDQNPHFSKYNKSINMLDKLDASKMILPKDLFQYPDQKEINQKLFRKLYLTKKEEALLPVMKIVKENSPEKLELAKDKYYQFKIDASNKVFPMKVSIIPMFGSFETFVSKSHSKPGPNACDQHIKNENFQVEYSAAENVKYIYFRIYALEDLQATITIFFSGNKKPNRRSLSNVNLKNSEQRSQETRKRQIYEFFHENMNQGEVKEMKEMIKQIRSEKKSKSLSMTNNQNLVEKNIQTVHDYKETKQSSLFQMAQKQAVLSFNSRLKKERIETERSGQKLYISFRHEMEKLEEGWKSSEIKRKQDKLYSERTWTKMTALLSIIDYVAKTKSGIKNKKFEKEKQENSARKIQKGIYNFLHKSAIVKAIKEDEQYREESDIVVKTLTNIYQAMNAVALAAYKRKKLKAQKTIARVFREMYALDPISEALNTYVNKIIKIQTIWRRNREIFYAQIEMFLIYWRKFCRILIQEEQKKRKKDNTEAIGKMDDEIVNKYARKFIKEKRKVFQEALVVYKQSNQTKSLFLHTEILENFDSGTKESNRPSLRPSLMKVNSMISKKKDNSGQPGTKMLTSQNASKALSELDLLLPSLPVKPKLSLKPTRQELRQIFNKILKGTKQ